MGAYASHLDHACSAADGQSIDDRPCEAYGRLHTLDELYEYYVSLDVAISKIRSGLLLGRSSFLKETRDTNKTGRQEKNQRCRSHVSARRTNRCATCRTDGYGAAQQRSQSADTVPFANVFTETGKGRVTQLPIRPVTNADDSSPYWGINQRVAEERRWLLSARSRWVVQHLPTVDGQRQRFAVQTPQHLPRALKLMKS